MERSYIVLPSVVLVDPLTPRVARRDRSKLSGCAHPRLGKTAHLFSGRRLLCRLADISPSMRDLRPGDSALLRASRGLRSRSPPWQISAICPRIRLPFRQMDHSLLVLLCMFCLTVVHDYPQTSKARWKSPSTSRNRKGQDLGGMPTPERKGGSRMTSTPEQAACRRAD
jgi:hypothetical protein